MSDESSTALNDEAPWVAQVLDFWFREVGEQFWFEAVARIDAEIRDRFLAVYEDLVANDASQLAGPRPLLAAIVALDQFSRNMFRGTARAFAADSIARRLAARVIELGLDQSMGRDERYFVYLPFEHSEDREDQRLAVRLIEPLGDASWTRYAQAHQRAIERFGRFPHRNAILGRTSSPDEIEALEQSPEAADPSRARDSRT
jgi:uncharacterized protein (DUF924 family)